MGYSFLSSPPHTPQSFLLGWEWIHLPAPGAACGCFGCVILPKCMDPLDSPNGKFNIYGVQQKTASEEAKEEITCELQITGHSL